MTQTLERPPQTTADPLDRYAVPVDVDPGDPESDLDAYKKVYSVENDMSSAELANYYNEYQGPRDQQRWLGRVAARAGRLLK